MATSRGLGSRVTLHGAIRRFNAVAPDPEVQRLKELLQQLTI